MTQGRSIKLNMAMNAALTMSSIIFPLITIPYVTRILGPAGVGRVYFASSVVTFFSIFAELGIPVYGIRACARVRDDEILLARTTAEIMCVNLLTCAAAYIMLGASVLLIPRLRHDRLLLIIMSSLILLNALGAEWLYRALEKYSYITIRSIIFKLIALAAMFLMVRSEDDYLIYGGLTIFAAAASNILNFINMRRIFPHVPASGRRLTRSVLLQGGLDLRQHIRPMLMFFALAVLTTIYTNLDLAFLGFMKGDAEAGLYGVAVRIKLVTVSLMTSVSAVLLPRNSYYYDAGRLDEFRRLISVTARGTLLISLPVVLLFIIFAPQCIYLIAGERFAGAVLPMRIIMPSVIPIVVSNLIGIQMLVPAGRESATVTASGIGAAADILLNLILIPSYASAGAAAAALAAEICVTAYMLREASRMWPGGSRGSAEPMKSGESAEPGE